MAHLHLDGWIGIWTFVTYLCFVAGQTPCLMASGKKGQCVSIFDCSLMSNLGSSATPNKPVVQNVSFCGLDKSTQTVQVCCASNECVTPDDTWGTCVELDSCPNLMNMLTTKPTITTIKHLHNHICQESENSICCVSETSKTPKPSGSSDRGVKDQGSTELETCQLGTLPPDHNSECCGIHSNIQQRIIGGVITEIDDYPWLVLLQYWIDGEIKIDCGGSLISGRFVLTAAHCVKIKPISVRLGEFNVSNPGRDCVLVAGAGEDCTDEPLIVEIDTIIPYPHTDFHRKYDIALIKLQKIVPYSDFIRPICLPTNDFTMYRREANLYVAGWGMTERNVLSDVKLKVKVPYVPQQKCRQTWGNSIDDNNICAGGELGKDSCKGDSGGPLMTDVGGKHEVVGIISYGSVPCGVKDIPGVHTKVYKFLPWIRQEIQRMAE